MYRIVCSIILLVVLGALYVMSSGEQNQGGTAPAVQSLQQGNSKFNF